MLNYMGNSFYKKINDRVGTLETSSASLNSRVSALETGMSTALGSISSLNSRVGALETQMTDRTTRIASLETWRANKAAAITKLPANPTVAEINILGIGIAAGASSVATTQAAQNQKINEIIDVLKAREVSN